MGCGEGREKKRWAPTVLLVQIEGGRGVGLRARVREGECFLFSFSFISKALFKNKSKFF
jgi:hypothetical protein